jgi:hypothetical protein
MRIIVFVVILFFVTACVKDGKNKSNFERNVSNDIYVDNPILFTSDVSSHNVSQENNEQFKTVSNNIFYNLDFLFGINTKRIQELNIPCRIIEDDIFYMSIPIDGTEYFLRYSYVDVSGNSYVTSIMVKEKIDKFDKIERDYNVYGKPTGFQLVKGFTIYEDNYTMFYDIDNIYIYIWKNKSE